MDRFVRHWRRARKQYAIKLNDVDPVTQDEPTTPFVVVLNESRQYVVFDAVATAQYILSSGKAMNPITRTEFNVVELRRLDKLTRDKGVPSVLENLMEAQRRAAAEDEHNQICQAMECEPSRLWSRIMDAPMNTERLSELIQMPFLISTYEESLSDYALVDAQRASEFHETNMQMLRSMEAGDPLIHSFVMQMFLERMMYYV